jgi:hypothetical protein
MRQVQSRERPARVAPLREAQRSDWIGRPAPGEALERSFHLTGAGKSASAWSTQAGAHLAPAPAGYRERPIRGRVRLAAATRRPHRALLRAGLGDHVAQIRAVERDRLRAGEQGMRLQHHLALRDLHERHAIVETERLAS